ncbi:hypothetical protein MHBO_001558 [Bonamia ostreae]|uniref:Uncharacterized protein n=1 Tax=Bonamia ostreae TaxID=126728 RepID=A0ABV2AK97_9EUKA
MTFDIPGIAIIIQMKPFVFVTNISASIGIAVSATDNAYFGIISAILKAIEDMRLVVFY